MRVVDFTNIGDLFKFHTKISERNILIDKARSGRTVFLINRAGTAYLSYDSIYGGKWVGHIHSEPGWRGKALWDFAYETAVWMVTYMSMQQLLCFVKAEDKRLRLFVKRYRMPMVAAVGDENLYVVTDKQILEFKEVEICHQ